ncbi:uncharacterized protein LOC116168284 [Photinus pyralis]|uniref:uncharacterized protein LOC116168284 n=1 Tax=Photinus pyralis TaxID=7054 RepID=UPI0012674E16|nr:uncharacterized protein LOC116168284 [Photinus pyralis]
MSVLLCISLARIIQNLQMKAEEGIFYFYLLFVIAIFPFGDCYLAQKVTTESEKLVYSYYDMDFIGTDLKFQKALIILIGRYQHSVVFTVGKFTRLSICTFITIIKGVYSYYMFLKGIKRV